MDVWCFESMKDDRKVAVSSFNVRLILCQTIPFLSKCASIRLISKGSPVVETETGSTDTSCLFTTSTSSGIERIVSMWFIETGSTAILETTVTVTLLTVDAISNPFIIGFATIRSEELGTVPVSL